MTDHCGTSFRVSCNAWNSLERLNIFRLVKFLSRLVGKQVNLETNGDHKLMSRLMVTVNEKNSIATLWYAFHILYTAINNERKSNSSYQRSNIQLNIEVESISMGYGNMFNSRGIIPAICFLLLLLYTSMATTSLLLMRSLTFVNVDNFYTYLSPNIQYFRRHLVYGIIAMIFTLLIVIGLPLLLLLEPFLNGKIKIKPFNDATKINIVGLLLIT